MENEEIKQRQLSLGGSYIMDVTPAFELTRFGFELARRMVARWHITITAIVICVGGAISIARIQGPRFVSTMKVVAADTVYGGGNGSVSILGINLGRAGSSRMQLYHDLLQSPTLARVMANKYHLDRKIFAGSVDPATGKWKSTFEQERKAFLFYLFGLTPSQRPTIEDLARTINGMIHLEGDSDSNTLTMSCVSASRDTTCPDLLKTLNHETQAIMNKMILDRARSLSEYLQQQIPKATTLEVRQALVSMLVDAQQQIATASMDQNNVTAVIQEPLVPAEATSPDPSFILSVSFLFGIMAGAAVTWLTWTWNFRYIRYIWDPIRERMQAFYSRQMM